MPQPTFGRDRELLWIGDFLGEAPPAVLLLEGPAGAGKSHLAEAGTRHLSRWWIAFPPPRAGVPARGLRRIADIGEDDRLRELLEDEDVDEAGKRRLDIFAAADDVGLSRGPRVIVLDDAQWADGLSLDWLSRCGESIRKGSTSLIIALRTGSPSRPAVERALAPLESQGLVHRIELGPLDASAVRELAGELGSLCDENEALELTEKSGGNPLLLKELCLRRQRRGDIHRVDEHLFSRSLEKVVEEQLAEVGASTRQVLAIAALAPQPAPETLVAAASDLEGERFDAAVEEALSSGLLLAATAGALAFRHDLQRESVEQQVPMRQRGRIHRRIAEALMERPDAIPLQIARQLVGAGDSSGAVEWLDRAGQHAVRCYDHSGAIEVFAEALRCCSPQEEGPAAGLIAQLVRASRLAARPQRGLEVLEELRESFADGPVGGHVLMAIARARGYLDDYDGRTEALLQAERAFTRWEQIPGRVAALSELAYPAGRLFSLEERIRYGRQGLAMAAELGDDFIWSQCAANLGNSTFDAGDASVLDLLDQARARLDTSAPRDLAEFIRQSLNLAMYHLRLGEYARSKSVLRETQAVVDELFWETVLGFVEGLVEWRLGHWDEAVPRLEAASREGFPGECRVGEAVRLTILFERGEPVSMDQLEGVVTYLVEKEEDVWASQALAQAVQVRGWRREPNPARGVLRHADVTRKLGLRAGWQDLLPSVAAVDVPLYERLSQILGQALPPGRHAQACWLLAEGIRLATSREPTKATDTLEGAATAFEGIGDPYQEAKAWEVLSRTVASPATARPAAQRAADLYSSIGAARSLTRLVRASKRRGLLTRHPVPASQRGKGAPGLTEREEQVAELAGRGHTTGEIARELVISPATVRKHLEHIKSKLGVKRKHELVRLLNE